MPNHEKHNPGWQFWIDRGGTFTDVVARSPGGELITHKLLSAGHERYDDAASEGIRRVLAERGGDTGARIDLIKIGTTVATNALLERSGVPAVLVVTAGFADALEIADQRRPALFALHVRRRDVPAGDIIEARERVAASGDVVTPLDEAHLLEALRAARARGHRHVAISFLHGYLNDAHERRAAALAREAGFTDITCGAETAAVVRYIPRTETTLVDAYLTPIVRDYTDRFRDRVAALGDIGDILFMQSSGGLIRCDALRGKDAVLSGPAGGIIGLVESATASGIDALIGFDMGGTSTDICVWDGAYEHRLDNEVAGFRLRAPMLRLDTIAAGGGSVLRWLDGRFQVGPTSAGADPGPAAYGRGGPPTITDANVVLGRIPAAHLDAVFGQDGRQPLDQSAAHACFAALARDIAAETGRAYEPADVAEGFLDVATANTAGAIRRMVLQRGEDPRRFTLCGFGGAAGQLACRVARELGIRQLWFHPLAGVLSAYGIGLADLSESREAPLQAPLADGLDAARARADALGRALIADMRDRGIGADDVTLAPTVTLQVRGSDTAMPVALGTADAMRAAFAAEHQRRFGIEPDAALDMTGVRVEARVAGHEPVAGAAAAETTAPAAPRSAPMRVAGDTVDVPVHAFGAVEPGGRIDGPAIVLSPHATIVVDPGWRADVNALGHLVLTDTGAVDATAAGGADGEPDPVLLEVFNNRFMQIAEQMGTVLEHTAHSVNIKERLDFSCALFDADGALIANAPHMPVHLGSMGASVTEVLRRNAGDMRPGDAWMLNSPYAGGTHLPDITLVTPWFDAGGAIRYFLATRAHHADVGGIAPGSMPSVSRHIDEEGVLFDNFRIRHGGRFAEAAVREALAGGPYPARNIDRNVADLRAQIAALDEGRRQLEALTQRYGDDTVRAYMGHVRRNAAACVRGILAGLDGGAFEYALDNGLCIRVRIDVDRDAQRATVDFDGTSGQHDGNFNAPLSVTRAALLYVLRALVERDIPLNDGCLEPVELRVPEGCFLNPRHPAAVVAGNVETSQCVVNALFGALGVMAAAQGTMNNLIFGNAEHQYYETIGGGTGAGATFDGASAVQSHMTNSRLTDPEVLERRLPVRVESFAIRRGSGGRGRHRGGDGASRRLRFLEAVEVSILSNHRRRGPFGLGGGEPGLPGRNRLVRGDGRETELGGVDRCDAAAGDQVLIETPGGGGYGAPTG